MRVAVLVCAIGRHQSKPVGSPPGPVGPQAIDTKATLKRKSLNGEGWTAQADQSTMGMLRRIERRPWGMSHSADSPIAAGGADWHTQPHVLLAGNQRLSIEVAP